jgi:hypothetical protein
MSEQFTPERDTATTRAKAKLGVLLVHGIGRQTEGVTLLEGGAPLLDWVSHWLSVPSEITHAVLKPSENSGGSCAQLEYSVPVDGQPQRLIVAESLWAQQFDPPPFPKICGWLLGYGCWIAFRQFVAAGPAWFRKWIPASTRHHLAERSDGWRWVSTMAALIFGLPGLIFVVVPLQLFLVALYLVSFVPIVAIKKQVMSAAVLLSEIIGDSYVWVVNRVTRSAITTKLIADLEWLEARSEVVVVLAHSQGAAVAFDALRRRAEKKPVQLITYGAGIRKLFEMENIMNKGSWAPMCIRFVWLLFILGFLAGQAIQQGALQLLSLPPAAMAVAYSPDFHFASLFVLGFSTFIFCLEVSTTQGEDDVDAVLKPVIAEFLKNYQWADFYASDDPVPNGPLLQGSDFKWRIQDGWETCDQRIKECVTALGMNWERHIGWEPLDGSQNFKTAAVINELDPLIDHTTYWNSADSFIVRVIERLNYWANLQWLPRLRALSSAQISRLRLMRELRIGLRNLGNFILFVSVIIVAWNLRDYWTLKAALIDQMPAVRAAFSYFSFLSIFMPPDVLQLLRVWSLGIGAHLLAVLLYVHLVSGPRWKWWNERFQRGQLPSRVDWHGGGRLLVWLLSILIPVYAAIRVIREHEYWILYTVIRDPVVHLFHLGDFLWLRWIALFAGVAWLFHGLMVSYLLHKPKDASATDVSGSQLSSEQSERLKILQPDPTKPMCVTLRLNVIQGDVREVDVAKSCGVPDVDRTIGNWVWNTHHYGRNFSAEKFEEIRVNSPILESPQVRLSWRAWRQVSKADRSKNGMRFISSFHIVIKQGKITDVQLKTSSTLPLVDNECRDFILKNWTAAEGVNESFSTSVSIHQGYYLPPPDDGSMSFLGRAKNFVSDIIVILRYKLR